MEDNITLLEQWEQSGCDIQLGLKLLEKSGSKFLTSNIVKRLNTEAPDSYLLGKLKYALQHADSIKAVPEAEAPKEKAQKEIPAPIESLEKAAPAEKKRITGKRN